VQCDKPLHPRQPRDRSGLPRSQMVTRLGERRVSFEECRFDEKNISIFREPNDLFNVRVRVGAIHNVGNLTARGDFHDLLFEIAKWKERGVVEGPIMPRNFNQSVVRRPAKRRVLKNSKPRPDRKPHGLHLIAPHIDVSPLFEGKCEDDLAVIEYSRTDLEAGLLEQEAFIALLRFALKALEPGAAGKLR
jgi:hypothetical protein